MDCLEITPLHSECSNLYFYGVSQLLANGHSVNLLNLLGETPLMTTISHSYKDPETATYIVSLLLLDGADPNLHGTGNLTPLMLATLQQNIAIQKLLLDAGADVNIRYKPVESCLIPYGSSALAIGFSYKNDFTSIVPLLCHIHDPNVLADAFQIFDSVQQTQVIDYILQSIELS